MDYSGGGAGWKSETSFWYPWLNEEKVQTLCHWALMNGFETSLMICQKSIPSVCEEQIFNPPKILGLKTPRKFPQFLKFLNQSRENNLLINIPRSLKKLYFYTWKPLWLTVYIFPLSSGLKAILRLENQNEIYLPENISSLTNVFLLMTENQANLLWLEDFSTQFLVNKV